MLQGLEYNNRLRLEPASHGHMMEVVRFFSMYPEVIGKELMSVIRVEARMRGL